MRKIRILFSICILLVSSCSLENSENQPVKNLTIFFVNDVHGQIENFAKVKHIVDSERLKTKVIVASCGDMFSGNPVVDNYSEKGYPIIDLMNDVGFDIMAVGNHEFDYGKIALKNRIEQSGFPWICANMKVNDTGVPQPDAYYTVTIDDLKITFLGLLETGGSKNAIIPSSHPWKVGEFTFEPAKNIVGNYKQLKNEEDADLLIALSHLGHLDYNGEMGDFALAKQNFFFDMIIGGHSHALVDTSIANIPIFQAGENLYHLGKIELSIKNKSIQSVSFSAINLEEYSGEDHQLKEKINAYNDLPALKEVIGNAGHHLYRSQVGCFYTDAMQQFMKVDVAFQNTGGVRSDLNEGNITVREIYEISPFNNGTVIYKMTVEEIKQFLMGSGSGFYYSGIKIQKSAGNLLIKDKSDREIPDDYVLKVGINDYIPAVHSLYFPNNGEIQSLSAAETLIAYLKNINGELDYSGCNQYFRY